MGTLTTETLSVELCDALAHENIFFSNTPPCQSMAKTNIYTNKKKHMVITNVSVAVIKKQNPGVFLESLKFSLIHF